MVTIAVVFSLLLLLSSVVIEAHHIVEGILPIRSMMLTNTDGLYWEESTTRLVVKMVEELKMASRPIGRIFMHVFMMMMVILLMHLGVGGPQAAHNLLSCDWVDSTVRPVRQIVLLNLHIGHCIRIIIMVESMEGRGLATSILVRVLVRTPVCMVVIALRRL